jgi:hypothetical protein
MAACAEKKAPLVVPPPAPAPPIRRPVKKERPRPQAPPAQAPAKEKLPPPPPPLLSPEAGQGEEGRLKQEAKARVEGAEQIVRQIDQNRLAKEQQETFSTIQSFLSKAKEALSLEDFLRAANLADKAQVLAQELLHTIR